MASTGASRSSEALFRTYAAARLVAMAVSGENAGEGLSGR